MHSLISPASIPILPRGVRLQHDRARNQWVIQAPERAFVLDSIAHAIFSEIDGQRSIAQIAQHLAQQYDASEEAISHDIIDLMEEMLNLQVITL
ncbi:pyrroloquinoline quinone biosynthesis peptide chaperone PqqD [Entomobacter blattae]|uniref:Coenzyme PQQ synthesis protein D n=1 Tax=Entomobacter blattae TaxID=2762277 RepID=A0A7H1NPR7_9PROT|nr:pyrroloquinoline quinone biosynthesis peptide chaperone PqqD [Entomobacter blattae]QNT77777.1 Coenzyme PQQ synthesis protein D [Entomobacter blattae]